MWTLQPIESGGESFFLLSGKKYVVGRKNCDILLPNDQSISREHAHFTVTEQEVSLKDSSKYGTFINGEKLETGSMMTLKTGDTVTFGVFQSKFRLEKESVVVCSSCVDNEGKVSLSHDVCSIGGRLVNSWTLDCTHLVMPTVKITIKTICALLCCRPIVTPEFFSVFSKAVQQKLPLPKPERFRPRIDEPSLSKEGLDLNARPERKSLFKGKTFVFLNSKQSSPMPLSVNEDVDGIQEEQCKTCCEILCKQQMKRLSQAVSCGGAVSQLLVEGSLPLSLLESSSTCVVDMISGNSQALISPTTKKWGESVAQILHRNGLRLITESEIGLAAIHVSNQTYCNPCSSIHSESVKGKPVMALATLSQSTAVDETALAAPSQNITAYVVNTETSHEPSRRDISGISAVGETPEKAQTTQKASRISTLSTTSKASLCPEPSSSRIITETEMSPESSSGVEPEHRLKTVSGSTALKQSPQKQPALTNYFQPVGKKRPREDSASSVQSESKFPRKEEKEINMMKNSGPPYAQQSSSNIRSHKTPSITKNQHNSEPQLNASLGQDCVSNQSSGSKKRKEPEQDVCEEGADLDLSLEELESIMSEEMDEPLQAAANKKQCLESGRSSVFNSSPNPDQKKSKKTEQSSANNIQQMQVDRKSPAASNQGCKRQLKRLSNQATNLVPETHSSASCLKRQEEDVKEEEVSFVVTSRTQNGSSQQCEAVAKQKMQTSVATSGTENDPELPRKLIQIQFMSLTVGNSLRSRSNPLQTRDPNGKNVKKFCKTSIPGLKGLPNIIGGSDLVAHNRSKNSELEEWLKQAAEEEKLNEREESLGDDLFRYNPRRTRK